MHSQRKNRIARILEVGIPIEIWDLFEDLLKEYGTPDKVIVESIKAHHREKFGSLEDITPRSFTLSSHTVFSIPISQTLTDGKIAKISENGKKFERRTQKELEKVDELLEKVSRLLEERERETKVVQKEPSTITEAQEHVTTPTTTEETKREVIPAQQQQRTFDETNISEVVKELRELASLKDLREEINSVKRMLKRLESSGFAAAPRRRRADLSDLTVSISATTDEPLAPPERPLLDNVLDNILLFDEDTEIEEDEEGTNDKEVKKSEQD
ncbi:MAG: hypothetical protein ACTSYD_12930 [Candidatus Heimdallarchaeaceae archaeon]